MTAPTSRVEPRTRASVTDRLQSLKLDQDSKRLDRAGGRRSRWWLWLTLLLVAAGTAVALAYFGMLGAAAQSYMSGLVAKVRGTDGPQGLEVEAHRFEPQGPETILDLSGTVKPKATHNVSPRFPGVVVELPIHEGESVNEGDALAKLDDTPAQIEFDQAQAGLDLAQAQLDELENGTRQEDLDQASSMLEQAKVRQKHASDEFDRAEGLGPTITDSELSSARTALEEANEMVQQRQAAFNLLKRGARDEVRLGARAKVAQMKAALENARYRLDHCTVRAPVSGTVLHLKAQLGETVSPSANMNGLSTTLCAIADLNQMEAEVDVQERDLHLVKVGYPCQISTEAYTDRNYEGTIDRVMPSVNPQRGVVTVRVRIVQPDQVLMPDMNCRVLFLKPLPPNSDKTLRVPEKALLGGTKAGGSSAVYVAVKGLAHRREVKLGDTVDGMVEVREGLREGEVVLVGGEKPLSEGLPVRPRIK